MTDYRDYKNVVQIELADGYKRQLRLDCGHSVFRYSKAAPKKAKCEHCVFEAKEKFYNEVYKEIEKRNPTW